MRSKVENASQSKKENRGKKRKKELEIEVLHIMVNTESSAVSIFLIFWDTGRQMQFEGTCWHRSAKQKSCPNHRYKRIGVT